MVLRRREGVTTKLLANECYRRVESSSPIQSEILDRAIVRLRADCRERLKACTSPQEREQLAARLVILIEGLRGLLFSVQPDVKTGLPPEVRLWTPQDILRLIDSHEVTNDSIHLILQWVMVHTSFRTQMSIEAASGVAKSVIARFNTGWYKRSPHQIPNGVKLLSWIRDCTSTL